jgi:ureidoacrylate peracid hydrolase
MTNVSETRRAARATAHVEPLFDFDSKVNPAHTALLIIDMQNDFCADGGMATREGFDVTPVREMAGRLPDFCTSAREAGVLVIFVRNLYTTEKNFYLSDAWLEQAARVRKGSYTLQGVCAAGHWGGEFYGNIRPEAGDVVVTKHRFNAFHNTDLETILRSNGIRTLVFSGCLTNVCVETTARDAFMRDYYVVVTSDGTGAYLESDHQGTLFNIARFFGQVASIAEVSSSWERTRTTTR